MTALPIQTVVPELSEASYQAFSEYITKALGIQMHRDKRPLLQGRLAKRLRVLGLRNLDQYKDYLFTSENGEDELSEFINLVTTHKTDFMREPQHFHFLANSLLPSMSTNGVRLWSAGCSTGEEAYSMAMVCAEHQAKSPGFSFSILGTDVSVSVLATARAAVYSEEAVSPIPLAWRQKYLLRSKNREKQLVKIGPELRSKVNFRCLNFMDAHYRMNSAFDVVFFRNVMIYYGKETQRFVLHRICENIKPGGCLFVGHTESITGVDIPLEKVSTAVYRRL